MEARFEIFTGRRGLWYFRLRARNSKIIAQSEGYTQKKGALNGIQAVRDCAEDSVILQLKTKRRK